MFIAGAVASPAAACSLSRFGFQPAEVAISHPKLLSSNWRPPVGRPLLPTHGRFSCRRLVLVASAADSTQPSSAAAAKTIVPDNGFSFSKVSFGVIGLAVGGSLLSYGFGAYFTIFPGSEWSAILLTYGFPLTVIGMALKFFLFSRHLPLTPKPTPSRGIRRRRPRCPSLHRILSPLSSPPSSRRVEHQKDPVLFGGTESDSPVPASSPVSVSSPWFVHKVLAVSFATDATPSLYAELKPVPCITYNDAEDLREKCATPILKQVRNDVTRFRYGDEQHLDEALKRIFQYGLVTEDGRYCLVLVFEAKALRLSDFEQRQAKFTSFFGPGIAAEIGKGGEADFYEVRLISQTTSEPSSQS
ncbi:hypothetical protein ZIOFF_068007 [Zingiber officinale]|uniref:Thylakoid membrane protein n=1 Tax=Zingiber officinale TaxID=94328 RepID=A0A8J5CXR9_ZINOF|nr:hypothetical protein ZIOFF_068007 [Zingiber officinale]